MEVSLLYFANREAVHPPAEYDLLVASATFADRHGFTAVWLPERHFHPFGVPEPGARGRRAGGPHAPDPASCGQRCPPAA